MDEAEVKALLDGTPEKFQLWVLLMLNCGMYQGDISDLKPTEVNWIEGRITRQRSKTDKDENAPIVNYILWRRTFDLLKKYGKRHGERVFLNRKDKPLVWREYKAETGKLKNQDSIYDTYRTLFPDKNTRKPLKALRKTGATTLDKHDVFMGCVEHYLAHKAHSITDQSYRNYSQERLDRAIVWLGEQFGIA